jgi:hypothetical protein
MANFANWESQLQARANEMLSRRIASLKAEIDRLQGTVSDIGSRLAEQESVIIGEESSSLIEEIKRWFDDRVSKVEEDFKSRLAVAAANARREAEIRIEEMREQFEASRRALTMSSAASQEAALFDRFTTASEDIVSQRTQSDILAALVRGVAQFAPRVVFFVIKSGDAVGWKASGFENGLNDESVKLLTVPAQKRTLLRDAISGFCLARSEPRSADDGVSEMPELYSFPAPEQAIAIPLIVLNKAVAALYADSGAQSIDSLNTVAAESLARIAGKTIELLISRRGAEPARPSALAAAAAETHSSTPFKTDGATTVAPQIEKTAETAPPIPPSIPDEVTIERRLTREIPLVFSKFPQVDEGLREAEAQLPEPAYIETEPGAPPDPRISAREGVETAVGVSGRLRFAKPQPELEQQTANGESAAAASPAPISDFAVPTVEEAPAPSDIPEFSPPPAPPIFTSPAKANKQAQPAAGTPGGETEQRAHNDARRFARLLVSEIKLYNAAKVNDGRRNYDLYERLKDEIDRSRKVYDKRVSPSVAASFDYFYDELVQTLAEGDPAKLGKDCPGPLALA